VRVKSPNNFPMAGLDKLDWASIKIDGPSGLHCHGVLHHSFVLLAQDPPKNMYEYAFWRPANVIPVINHSADFALPRSDLLKSVLDVERHQWIVVFAVITHCKFTIGCNGGVHALKEQ